MAYAFLNKHKLLGLFAPVVLIGISLSCAMENSDLVTRQHNTPVSIEHSQSPPVTKENPTVDSLQSLSHKQKNDSATLTPTISTPEAKGIQIDEISRVDPAPADFFDENKFSAAPDRDLYKFASELLGTEPVFTGSKIDVNPIVGSISTFWLFDLYNLRAYQSDLELKAITPNAYWYFEPETEVEPENLRKAIKGFEDMIYPEVSNYFGEEWRPGIDDDPRLFLVHAPLNGAAGYFSSGDEHETRVSPFSNQREVVYLSIPGMELGTNNYLQVLAHELQHLIHWNHDPTEETWVNEGLSELSVAISGFGHRAFTGFTDRFAKSLVHWPLNEGYSAYYGGAGLFMHYMAEHYSSGGTLMGLIQEEANGIEGINNYLQHSGFNTTFNKVFGDWVIANLLDEDSGIYGYSHLDVQSKVGKILERESSVTSSLPEYSVEYWEVKDFDRELTLQFEGDVTTSLLPVDIGKQGCWWSNSGDSIDSSMTVNLDLTDLVNPVFEYSIWYNIENNWDYGYFQISVDGGEKWNVISTKYTSDENPIGNSFGPGYTGDSEEWLRENIDLKSYSDQKSILIRFKYITDDAINGSGLCIREMKVTGDNNLVKNNLDVIVNGFQIIDNLVPQEFIVQIIKEGRQNEVVSLPLDDNNVGRIVLDSYEITDKMVVAVASLAPKTLARANYRLIAD